MLTRNMLRIGEGKLKTFYPEAGRAHRRRNMDDEARNEEEINFQKTFYTMEDLVKNLF